MVSSIGVTVLVLSLWSWLWKHWSWYCKMVLLLHHTYTHPFNGPFSGTNRVSRYQKGKTNLDFTEARDSEWQWHQLGHVQVCTSLQTDTTPTPHRSVFTGRMPFLPPNQRRQSTEVALLTSLVCGREICLWRVKSVCVMSWVQTSYQVGCHDIVKSTSAELWNHFVDLRPRPRTGWTQKTDSSEVTLRLYRSLPTSLHSYPLIRQM